MMKWLFCVVMSLASLYGDEPQKGEGSTPPFWQEKMRARALRGLDQFLDWTLSKNRSYAVQENGRVVTFQNPSREIHRFARHYSYFSPVHPLVAKVTAAPDDIQLIQELLLTIHAQIVDPLQKESLAMEVLAKGLAYRDLHVGDSFTVPLKDENVTYIVDRIFNLWQGMPAFGLVPEGDATASPLLLFRGTDLSLDSQRSWASVMSDLDMAGPGLSTFQKGREEIHGWLEEVEGARVIGFSLGGALAGYTFIYENALMRQENSYTFCMPGLSEGVVRGWQKLPPTSKKAFISYVNRGDVVSKVGLLLGTVYQLSVDRPLRPLEAHTLLMFAEPALMQTAVDVSEENFSR